MISIFRLACLFVITVVSIPLWYLTMEKSVESSKSTRIVYILNVGFLGAQLGITNFSSASEWKIRFQHITVTPPSVFASNCVNFLNSDVTVLRQVVCGIPLFFLPCGVWWSAIFCVLFWGILITCLSHLMLLWNDYFSYTNVNNTPAYKRKYGVKNETCSVHVFNIFPVALTSAKSSLTVNHFIT